MKRFSLSPCLLVWLAQSVPAITISGTVTDVQWNVLAGVGVSLALSGGKTTTDALGGWSLDWSITGVTDRVVHRTVSRWTGKAVELTLPSVSDVTVEAFTLNGSSLGRTNAGHLEAGFHSIPMTFSSAGLTWLRVTTNGHTETLLAGLGSSSKGRATMGAGRTQAVPDTLLFTWKSAVMARQVLNAIPTSGIQTGLDTTTIAIPAWQTGIIYGSVTDSAGQGYRTVRIGTQTWMAENLNFAGTSGTKGYCYNNVAGYCEVYGRLYTWAEVMGLDSTYNTNLWNGGSAKHQGICPTGWHVPSDSEWTVMKNVVDSTDTVAGTKLKSRSGWYTDSGTDVIGFRVLPAGYGYIDGPFYDLGSYANLWSASQNGPIQALSRLLCFSYAVYPSNGSKSDGYSLRCVQD